ncbi:MAG: CDP-diacylglycerol--glycerol-3-phosphate 3-phosphatidyltransferase [Planctomycetes bacterium]|nr:CDP-diacylglycerol--glycerol-3-phosphate 3-phosphatidyltransferase [Planctomycetota bacterium]
MDVAVGKVAVSSTQRSVLHLPNLLTLYRIVLSPVFILVFSWSGSLWARVACLALVTSFLITDYLDGYFARKRKLVSDSGKLLDPLADKVCNFSIFLCFLVQGYAHVWMVAAIFYRDALVNLLRAFAAARNIIIGARVSGKVKTAIQGAAMTIILALLVWEKLPLSFVPPAEQVKLWSNWLMGAVAVITCLSLVDYLRANWHIVREM